MAITSTNYTDISYIEEVTPGVIPDNSPTNFTILPTTGGAPAYNLSTEVSNVIRSDRQTDDLVIVDADVTGDLEFELAYAPYKDLLISLLRGTPDTVTTPGSIIVKNSNLIPTTYTFVKRVLGISDPAYFYYNGVAISQMVFNFETGSILTGTVSLFGREEQAATDASPLAGLTSQAFLNPPAYRIMNSVQNVVTNIVGLPAGTEYSSLTLTINNNTTGAKAIGTLGSIDIADFTLEVMGDITLYFQDLAAYNLFLASTDFSLQSTLTDGDGNVLVVDMPYCKFETLDTPIPGKDNFLMLEGSLRALRDPIDDYMVGFTFTP